MIVTERVGKKMTIEATCLRANGNMGHDSNRTRTVRTKRGETEADALKWWRFITKRWLLAGCRQLGSERGDHMKLP